MTLPGELETEFGSTIPLIVDVQTIRRGLERQEEKKKAATSPLGPK